MSGGMVAVNEIAAAVSDDASEITAPARIARDLGGRLPKYVRELPARQGATRVAVVLVVLAFVGLALAAAHAITPTSPTPKPAEATVTAQDIGDFGPIPLPDPMHDLTMWYSDRVHDGNSSAVDGMKGTFLTPVDPLNDKAVTSLYGKMVIVALPILILLAIAVGVMIMTARSSGQGAYSARAMAERYIVGALLMGLGVFMISLASQLVTAVDQGMVEMGLPSGSVGGPDAWPTGGGVFHILQLARFDSHVTQGGPGNAWNTGAWLSGGLLAAILTTLLGMINAGLTALETLLIIVSPFCLLAYATRYSTIITSSWLKLMAIIYMVRFTWTILFVLFSMLAFAHMPVGTSGDLGDPATLGDTNALLAIATGASFLMFLLPIILVPLAIKQRMPIRLEGAAE